VGMRVAAGARGAKTREGFRQSLSPPDIAVRH